VIAGDFSLHPNGTPAWRVLSIDLNIDEEQGPAATDLPKMECFASDRMAAVDVQPERVIDGTYPTI
jgi:hypothetical protein